MLVAGRDEGKPTVKEGLEVNGLHKEGPHHKGRCWRLVDNLSENNGKCSRD